MICNNCGRTFDEPARAHQMHYEVDTMREESYSICPHCHSEEIEESDKCPVCGEEKPLTEDYCKTCSDTIHNEVGKFIKAICAEFLIDQRTAVDWILTDIDRRN